MISCRDGDIFNLCMCAPVHVSVSLHAPALCVCLCGVYTSHTCLGVCSRSVAVVVSCIAW